MGDTSAPAKGSVLYDFAASRELQPVEGHPAASWKLLKENPCTAFVLWKGKTFEPLHHHTANHDILILKGHCVLQNVSNPGVIEFKAGDFMSLPEGEVHRVYYYEDTEFLLKFEGPFGVVTHEDDASAKKALSELLPGINFE